MTTQEIVKALKCCADETGGCDTCPIYNTSISECYKLRGKAADLIGSLMAELEQVKREQDEWKRRAEAAVRDMDKSCVVCKYYAEAKCTKPNAMGCFNYTGTNVGWEWRGVCPENEETESE